MSNTVAAAPTPWARWKANPADALWLAFMIAGLGTAGLILFLIIFVADPHRLLLVGGCFFVAVWAFFLGVSALNAYLMSHPKFSTLISTKHQTTD